MNRATVKHMEIVGHRGAGLLAPENTLRAFTVASSAGCHRAELDVRMTRDGRLAVIHDETVDRTTNATGVVAEMSLSEIQQLDAGAGERVPELQEVLRHTRGKLPLQIEIKEYAAAIPAFDATRSLGLLDVTLFSSFLPEALQALRERSRETRLVLLTNRVGEDTWVIARTFSCEVFGVRAGNMDEMTLRRIQEEGWKAYAFHMNERSLGSQLTRWGVHMIGTDHPEWFLSGPV